MASSSVDSLVFISAVGPWAWSSCWVSYSISFLTFSKSSCFLLAFFLASSCCFLISCNRVDTSLSSSISFWVDVLLFDGSRSVAVSTYFVLPSSILNFFWSTWRSGAFTGWLRFYQYKITVRSIISKIVALQQIICNLHPYCYFARLNSKIQIQIIKIIL